MGTDIVMRHSEGAPLYAPQSSRSYYYQCTMVTAHEYPTQALLDMYSI